MSDMPASSKTKRDNTKLLDRLTGTTAKITALLVAITALLSQVPLVKDAARSAYCDFASCGSPEKKQDNSTASLLPTTKALTFGDIVTIDGSRSRSGTMTKISVSLIDNKGRAPDTFVAQWTWSGSGGTQQGSQTVIIDLKSETGATLQSLSFPLDRSHCFYPGHDERHEGKLNIAATLVTSINVSVTPVEGTQGRC
jgi:hypothetical protein